MAFYLFLLFTTSFFLHFTSRFPALGSIRFDFILYVILAGLALVQGGGGEEKGDEQRIVKALLVFFACALLSVPFAMWPGSVLHYGLQNFLKCVAFFLYVVKFVRTERQLAVFMIVFLGCQVFRGLEPAYLHLTKGYWGDFTTSQVEGEMIYLDRLSGAPHDIVNPNQLAWVIINIIPFFFYLGVSSRKKLVKIATAAILALLLYPLALTGSRTGLVSIMIVIFVIIYLGKNRLKRMFLVSVVAVPVLVIVTSILDPQMLERYTSLVDRSAIGADTAAGRIAGLKGNLSTIMNIHGILGHGLGTSVEVHFHYSGSTLMPHNMYIEALQEVGIVGLFLFLRYIATMLSVLNKARGRLQDSGETGFLAGMVKALLVWIVMDIVYSLACFGLISWEWYLFGGLSVVTVRLANKYIDQDGDGVPCRPGARLV